MQGQQVPQAFQALSELLFSEDSPIDKWKVTDMARVDQQSRVGEDAQFTLYVKPDQEDTQYRADRKTELSRGEAPSQMFIPKVGNMPVIVMNCAVNASVMGCKAKHYERIRFIV